MENWKRGLIAGSAGLSLVFLLKGSRTGALIFSGAALATLASEYPEKFVEVVAEFCKAEETRDENPQALESRQRKTST